MNLLTIRWFDKEWAFSKTVLADITFSNFDLFQHTKLRLNLSLSIKHLLNEN